jgi:nucleotide-binding universal stress UspA family protein
MEASVIRHVLVHLDGGARDEHRVQHAEAIATSCAAHLTGLYTNPVATFVGVMPLDGGAAAAEVMADLEEEVRRTGDVVERRLAGRFERLSVRTEVRRLDGTSWQIAQWAASEARCADLFVLDSPLGERALGSSELFEAVLFGGGRAVYVVPPAGKPPEAIRQVLVAWRDTRESARALAEALPFVARATRTVIVAVDAGNGEPEQTRPADVARHLRRHGPSIELFLDESGGRPVADVILDRAIGMSADLIVMGGYGHSRAREWVLGGATREMLGQSDFPILMAH